MFKVAPEMWVAEAIVALISPAVVWCQKFCQENQSLTWKKFSEQICDQYTSKTSDIIILQELDSLMHTGSIKDYMETHMKICQCVSSNFNVESVMVRHNFMENMKPYLYKLMNISQCKSFINTYIKARNKEEKAHFSSRQNQSSDKNQNHQKGCWRDSNKCSGSGKDQAKEPEKYKFPYKKFGDQNPQQTS